MKTRVLAASSPGEVRVAVMQDGRLADYSLWRPGAPDGVGDLHRGRVTARVPAMAGAFVALENADGFLPDTEGAADLTEGATPFVRVTRAAQGGKGPRLTGRLSGPEQTAAAQAGPGPPRLLRRGPGALERLAAAFPDAPVLADDAALIAALRPALGTRLSLAPDAFDDALLAEIEALSEPSVSGPGGMTLHIHPTPALVAIDVDSGTATAVRQGKQAAQMAANRAALPELARQIRLRNLSGAILADLAGLPMRRRAALGPDLAAALAADPLRPRLLGFTGLGLAEIVRPRIHPPLHELLAGPHAAGLEALRRAATEAANPPHRLPTLRAAPAVIAALEADPVALPDLARRAGRSLPLRADPSLAPTFWRLEHDDERPRS